VRTASAFRGVAFAVVLAFLLLVPLLPAFFVAAAVAGAAAIALGYRMARVVGPEEVSILRRVPAPGMASVVNWLGRSSS